MKVYFSSSSKVNAPPEWVFGIADAGFDGWEVVADGAYRLDDPAGLARVRDLVERTGLAISVHAPYADLNAASRRSGSSAPASCMRRSGRTG
jgi:sugar phosphate isomerase/epimerase